MLSEQITAGARTVAHMAVYFEELKTTAREMLAKTDASQRGYFTPNEDEAVRQLLISYWQARAALLDLVISFRDSTPPADPQRPAAFLVAYSAAVLLVDAARFLRESFGDRPLVRQKLNEPEPHFGIPPCTYDTVQHSLTSLRHAWHLYHAMQYFDTHEPELRRLAAEPHLVPVMNVIDRLGDRLRVQASLYAKTRMRVRGRNAIRALRQDVIGQALYGLQKLMGCLASGVCLRPGHRPGLPEGIVAKLRSMVQPGDVLITRKEYAATNYFLPCFWPHAALYLGGAADLAALGLETHEHVRPRWAKLLAPGEPERGRVLEALKDGVWIRPATAPLACDSFVIIRPTLHRDDLAAALGRGMFHEGKPYDFDFDFTRSDRLVCTEVVYRSYDGLGGMRFDLKRRAGRLTLSAGDLLEMSTQRRGFETVAAYVPGTSCDLTEGVEAEQLVVCRMGPSTAAV